MLERLITITGIVKCVRIRNEIHVEHPPWVVIGGDGLFDDTGTKKKEKKS